MRLTVKLVAKRIPLFLPGLLLTASGFAANAVTIFNTGQNVTAGRDNTFQIITDSTGETTTPAAAYVVQSPASAWAAPLPNSNWIAPAASQSSRTSCCPNSGDTYRTTFSLSGVDPTTVVLQITYMVDDSLTVLLNGAKVYTGPTGTNLYTSSATFTLNSGFVSGTNTLDFVVFNQINATGLDVSITQILPPTINAGGIVPNAGTSSVIESGSWVSIYGSNFAGAPVFWTGNFPTSLTGVSVTIDGKPAYIWFVSPTQINLQVPSDTATGPVIVTVTTSAGSVSSIATLSQYAPVFSLLSVKYPAAIVQTPGSSGNSGGGYDIIGPTGAFSYPTRPVKAGETLVLFSGGFGPTTPPVPAGAAFSGAAPCVTLPTVTIGGVPARLTFAGIVGAGLYQINLIVPAVPSGDQPLAAMIGGLSTQSNIFVTIQ